MKEKEIKMSKKYLVQASVNPAETYPTDFTIVVDAFSDDEVVDLVEGRVRNLVKDPMKKVHIRDVREIIET